MENLEDLQYPIGRFQPPPPLTAEQRASLIGVIAALPGELRAAVAGLSPAQLDTPYRPEGWTVRQVVHHVADSHMHAYLRFKWAVTEESPTIKPYDERRWSELPDARTGDIRVSLALVEALHERWALFLRSLDEQEFGRMFRHPELGDVALGRNLALYAWHGRHHTAHITGLRQRMGW
jgi:uncharacterized damage-inducible protein DinB